MLYRWWWGFTSGMAQICAHIFHIWGGQQQFKSPSIRLYEATLTPQHISVQGDEVDFIFSAASSNTSSARHAGLLQTTKHGNTNIGGYLHDAKVGSMRDIGRNFTSLSVFLNRRGLSVFSQIEALIASSSKQQWVPKFDMSRSITKMA